MPNLRESFTKPLKLRTSFILALVLGAISVTTSAQAHKVGAVDYSDWRTDSGFPCCGGQDCLPVAPGDVRKEKDGTYSVFRYGTWTNFPIDHMVSFPSPDAQVHACMSVWADDKGHHQPYCIALPGGS